jgi:hypothetical protein
VPVARHFALGKAKGMIGSPGVSGWGIGLVHVRPVAVLVETDEGVDRITIRDAAVASLWRMFGTAVVVALLFAVGIRFACRLMAERTGDLSPAA